MIKLGIIGAMAVEVEALKNAMENMTVTTRTILTCIFGAGPLDRCPVWM